MCQSPPPESRRMSSGVTMLTLSSSNLIHSSKVWDKHKIYLTDDFFRVPLQKRYWVVLGTVVFHLPYQQFSKCGPETTHVQDLFGAYMKVTIIFLTLLKHPLPTPTILWRLLWNSPEVTRCDKAVEDRMQKPENPAVSYSA